MSDIRTLSGYSSSDNRNNRQNKLLFLQQVTSKLAQILYLRSKAIILSKPHLSPLHNKNNSGHRVAAVYARFGVLMLVAVLAGLNWTQFSAPAALAQTPPALPANLRITVTPDNGDAATPPAFSGGDTFEISVLAKAVPEPGIFGGQLEIHFDPNHLAVADDSVRTGPLLEPALVVQSEVDLAEGIVYFAASRQGDVDNLVGDVVLVNLTFKTLAATEPVSTSVTLENIKLGAKGGAAIPVGAVSGLNIFIEQASTSSSDLGGQITLEGRLGDQTAEVSVTAVDAANPQSLLQTEFDGSFLFKSLFPGNYSLTATSPGYLPATCPLVVHHPNQFTRLIDVTLWAGDINGDGEINVADAVAIGAGLNAASTEPAVDLNRDGAVDVLDLILMAANYGQSSAGNPWVCRPGTGG